MHVEADIFSGRPNPAWTLDAGESAQVAALVSALRPGPPGTLPDGLGYRGMVLRDLDDALPGCTELRLHAGTAVATCPGGPRHLSDPDRALEVSLARTAEKHVDAEVYTALRESIGF